MNAPRGRRLALIWVGRVLILAVFFGLWQVAATTRTIDPILIGTPSGIALFLWQGVVVTGSLLQDFGWTMLGTFMAFALGSAAGVALGIVFITNPVVESLLSPILMGLNAMPRIALAPLFLIWFGLGIWSKVAIGSSLTFFIVLTSTVAGGRGVSQDHLVLARTLDATGLQQFLKFTLPSAVPVIFNGLRLGLIYALLGVVAGEIIAAEHGLGQTLSLLAANFQTNGVFAVIILLALTGMSLTWLMSRLEDRLLLWR